MTARITHRQGTGLGDRKTCRVALYARFSSDRQNPESANDQIARAKRRIEEGRIRPRLFPSSSFDFKVEEAWILKDEARSGKTVTRTGYELLLHGLRSKAFDLLVVDDLSRLTRELGSLLDLYNLLQFYSIELVSIADAMSSADPGAKIAFTVKGMVNEMGNEAHANRTKRGQEQKKVNGFSTGDICYGFGSRATTNVKKGGREVPANFRPYVIPEQAMIVNEIFDLFLQGKGSSSICHVLNERKVPSSKRSQARTGKAYNWGPSAINAMLRNPKYIGIWTWSRYQQKIHPETGKKIRVSQPESEWVHHLGSKDAVDPELVIIPREKWEAAQQRLRKRTLAVEAERDRPAAMRSVKVVGANCEAIFSSVLRCYSCLGPFYQVSGKGDGYYGCYLHHRKDRTACANRRLLPRGKVDKAVVEKLKEVLLDPHHLELATGRYNQLMREKLKAAPQRSTVLQGRLQGIEVEIANLLQFIMSSGASTPTSIRDMLVAKEAEKRAVSEELQVIERIGEDRIFLTVFALKQKMEALKTYLDQDSEVANRAMKLFFPDGLIARPAGNTEQTRCNRHRNPWTLSGVVIMSPDSRFTDLEYGGHRTLIVEPYRVEFSLLI